VRFDATAAEWKASFAGNNPTVMHKKSKFLSLSILWASLLVAEAILYDHTPHYGMMIILLFASATMSVVIFASPDCKAQRRDDLARE
jgi:hypothetical protein